MQIPLRLIARIEHGAAWVSTPAVDLLIRSILARFDGNVQAILFYGSCRRTGNAADGLVDLYVLVDAYRAAYRKPLHAALNRWLPPNVFYLEIPIEKKTVRAKYAVISLGDFQKGVSSRWFHSYLWGRFCQPANLIYARDARTAAAVNTALARAVLTFITRVLPCMPQSFSIRALWLKGLQRSYQAELRSERPDRPNLLYDAAPAYFERITRLCLEAVPWRVTGVFGGGTVRYRAAIPSDVRLRCRAAWRLRIFQGKLLSALRLLKAVLTFEGGVDYILWKIERHSGVVVDQARGRRRRSLPAVAGLACRLYRRGAFH